MPAAAKYNKRYTAEFVEYTFINNKGKKVTDTDKKINGKTYYFNEDGEMQYGWHEEDGNAYYLGTEDEGWRAESQWLWLEKSGNNENDLDDDDDDDLGSKYLDS